PVRPSARIDIHAADGAEAGGVMCTAEARDGPQRLEIAVFGADTAADLDAGVRARNVEEAGSVHGTDTDVLDRRGLPHGKVGRHGTAGESKPSDAAQQQLRYETHSSPPSPTLPDRMVCIRG